MMAREMSKNIQHLLVQYRKRHFNVVTDFLDIGPEQYPFEEVEVFGYHGDHIEVPDFGKGLHGRFKFVAEECMETMIDIYQIIIKKFFVFLLPIIQFPFIFCKVQDLNIAPVHGGYFYKGVQHLHVVADLKIGRKGNLPEIGKSIYRKYQNTP